MEFLLIFDFYFLIMSMNVGINEKLKEFSSYYEYDGSDDFLMYIPIINCFTLIILIIRYFQWKY